MWTTHSTEPAVQPHQRNGSTHVPAGTSWRSDTERDPQFYSYAAAPTARSKNSPVLSIACIVTASFRATATARLKPTLSQLQAPCSQTAFSGRPCQNDRRGLKQQTTQMTVASAGYVAIIINFSRLVAPSRQSKPSSHGTRLLEVVWILYGRQEAGGRDHPRHLG